VCAPYESANGSVHLREERRLDAGGLRVFADLVGMDSGERWAFDGVVGERVEDLKFRGSM
jgi:hypothetical protein